MADHRIPTVWHVFAFLGELGLWGMAARLGWLAAPAPMQWVGALLALVGIIAVWAVWAAPKSPRRLRLRPRLGLIASLGVLVGGGLGFLGHGIEAAITAATTVIVVIAQYVDERR